MQEPTAPRAENDHIFPSVSWGARELLVCTIVVLVALFVVSIVIVGPVDAEYGQYAAETLVASGIANIVWNIATLVAVLYFVRRSGGNLLHLGLGRPPGRGNPWPRIAGLAFVTFLSLYIVTFAYGLVVEAFGLDFLEPDEQIPDEFYDSDTALAVLGVGIVIGAPVTEEIFFRGFLFGGARRYIGVPLAALSTGLLFSLAHANLGLIVPFSAIGAVFSFSYYYTRSLYVPMGAHFLFNLVSYSILVFIPEARPD